MRQSRLLLAASSLLALAMAACSAAESSVPASTHRTPTNSGSNNGNGTSSGSGSSSGNGTSNGATPPAGTGTSTPPSGGTTPPSGGTTTSTDETWDTGKQISASVTIAAGSTVTIAPSAQIAIADGATITVQGTLKGASTGGAAHAKLTGSAWGGVIVASGGTLSLDGVDIDNASTAIFTQSGNAAATFDNATINAPTTPFKVNTGSKLSMTKSAVVGSKGQSLVGGSFTASYLDYDSNGNEGVAMSDASAVFTVDDSKFHGTSNGGGDMIVANNAATIHLSHTEIQKCHCAFHFNGVTNYDISFMNIHDDSYGFMQYGSDPASGTRTISDSNFVNLAGIGIDESGTNGLITATNVYFSNVAGGNVHLVDSQIKVATPVKNPVAGVGPRP